MVFVQLTRYKKAVSKRYLRLIKNKSYFSNESKIGFGVGSLRIGANPREVFGGNGACYIVFDVSEYLKSLQSNRW